MKNIFPQLLIIKTLYSLYQHIDYSENKDSRDLRKFVMGIYIRNILLITIMFVDIKNQQLYYCEKGLVQLIGLL